MRNCPRCSDPLPAKATSCTGCGWKDRSAKDEASYDPRRLDCAHEDRGLRCSQMGTLSPSTSGGGAWFCAEHFPAFRNMLAGHAPPPGGFRALRSLLPREPDPEGDAERAAIEGELLL